MDALSERAREEHPVAPRGVRWLPMGIRALLRSISDRTKNVARLSLATALGQSVQVLGALLLARLYAPEEFGSFAFFLGLNAILLPFCTLRYEWAIPVALHREDAVHVLHLAFCVGIMNSVVIGCVGALIVWFLADLGLATPMQALEMLMLPATLLAVSVRESCNSWFVRTEAFSTLSRIRLLSLAIPVLVQVLFGLLFGGSEGLIGGFLVATFISAASAMQYYRWDNPQLLRSIDFKALRRVAVTYKRFGQFSFPASVLNAAVIHIPAIVFPLIFSTAMAGSYALAQRVVMQPVYLINYSIQSVFWGEASRLTAQQPAKLSAAFFRTSAIGAALAAPTLILFPYGPDVFALLFGRQWTEAGAFSSFLALSAVAYIVATSTNCLHIVGRNHWQVLFEASQLTLFVLLLGLSAMQDWPPLTTVASLTVGSLVCNAALWLYNAALARAIARAS